MTVPLVDEKESTGTHPLTLRQRVRRRLFPPGGRREAAARRLKHGVRRAPSWAVTQVRRALAWSTRLRWRIQAWLGRELRRALVAVARALAPRTLKAFYRRFRSERQFPDRSEVVVYASTALNYDTELPRRPLEAAAARRTVQVSLVTTVRDEASNLQTWLDSLLAQARLPDEVIIVDGGSRDGTLEALQAAAEQIDRPALHVISTPGANIAQGRNLAIRQASSPVVVSTDLGCTLDPHWLERLVAPFEDDPEIVMSAGYYGTLEGRPWDRLVQRFFVADLDEVDAQRFLPSTRSVAFRKSLWAQVGGIPEALTFAGEDTLFGLMAKARPGRWAFVPEARVFWHGPSSPRRLWRTVVRYARGDGEAGIFASAYWWKALSLARLALGLLPVFVLLVLGGVLGNLWLLGAGLFIALGTAVHELRAHRAQGLAGWELVRFSALSRLVDAAQVLGFWRGVRSRAAVEERQLSDYRRQVAAILAAHPERKGVVIYPPTHDWGFMFQRPHQLARAFARQGYVFFFCTNNERADAVVGFEQVEPGLYVSAAPLESFAQVERPMVYIGSPWHRPLVELFNHPLVIYDHYDDLEVSSARREDHEALLQRAEVVVVTSTRLWEGVRTERPDAVLAPNGVDYAWIQAAKPAPDQAPPADLEPILARGKPVVGYSGALANWFDYDLLRQVATERPELEFVLIGVSYDGSLEASGVLELDNVHWLGLKPYQELFPYVWHFDVGTIPFKVNEITLSTSPIKLFEYMAAGKPVVTTDLPECRATQGVCIATGAADFSSQLDRALQARSDPDYLAQIDRVARENTWEERVERILAAARAAKPRG
jgi:glycosyltransferase involved in cell wall biosynthesis